MSIRTGMTTLVEKLRGMSHAGTGDYSVWYVEYWTDDQLQEVLDRNRKDIYSAPMEGMLEYSGGAPVYYAHHSGYSDIESGTAVFRLEDSTGALVSTSLYTMDYLRGVATFSANTAGTIYYLTGRTYDLNAAAADVWQQKAGHYAASYDIQTDGHGLKRSQLIQHCFQMAQFYASITRNANTTLTMYRSDGNA